MPRRRGIARSPLSLLPLLVASVLSGGSAAAEPARPPAVMESISTAGAWVWPATPFRLERPYAAPAHRYGSGHRGIDVRPLDTLQVRAPAAGTIAFSGTVADRGVLTIDHGGGLVTTLEPVDSVLGPGAEVDVGEAVGTLALGGHSASGALHFGVRLDGEYINPLLLLGGVPRAVLLPCC